MSASTVMPLPENATGATERIAGDLRRTGQTLGHTQIASGPVSDVPGWSGESASAYLEEARALRTHVLRLVETFPRMMEALHTWGAASNVAVTVTVPALWERYDRATSRHLSASADLRDEVDAAAANGTPIADAEVHRRQASLDRTLRSDHSDILREYRTAMDTLDDEAQTTATTLRGVLASVVDPALVDQGRGAVGASLFDDMPLVDGQAEWELAQRVAPRIAAAMRDEDLTEEDLRSFHDSFAPLLANPFVAAALAEIVTPAQMLTFSLRVGGLGWVEGGLAEDVMRDVGTALVLSTGGLNLGGGTDHAQMSMEVVRRGILTADGRTLGELTEDTLQGLREAGRTTFHPHELTRYSSWYDIQGYDVLSQLMGAAAQENPDLALGAGFFQDPAGGISVAQDLVAWDSESPGWRSLHGYTEGPTLFGHDSGTRDPMHSMYLLMDRPALLDGGTAADPALVRADEGRLDGIRHFLSGNTTFKVDLDHDGQIGEDETPIGMTRYLTGWRQGSVGMDYFGFQDGGEAFGKVINQASHPVEFGPRPTPGDPPGDPGAYDDALGAWQTLRDRDAAATAIALDFVHGYQDGLDLDHTRTIWGTGDQIDGQDVFGFHNRGLRSWAGVILAPHVEDLALSLTAPGRALEVLPTDLGTGHRFTFDNDFANRLRGTNGLFVDLGFDAPPGNDHGTPEDPSDDTYPGRAPAIDNLLVATRMGYETDLHDALADGRSLDRVASDWAALTQTLFTAPTDASENALIALDARNARWQKLITAGVGAIPFGDIVDDKAVEWVLDQGKDNALTPTLESILSTDNASAGARATVSRGEMAETYMQDALMAALAQGVGPDAGPVVDLASAAAYEEGLLTDVRILRDGAVIPPGEMNHAQRNAWFNFLTTENGKYGGHDFGAEFQHLKTALNMEDIETDEARSLEKPR